MVVCWKLTTNFLLFTPPGGAVGSTSLTVDDGDDDEDDEDEETVAFAAATVAVGLFRVDESSCWFFEVTIIITN